MGRSDLHPAYSSGDTAVLDGLSLYHEWILNRRLLNRVWIGEALGDTCREARSMAFE